MKLALFAVSLLAVLGACKPATPTPATAPNVAAALPAASPAPAPARATLTPFSVDVTLSEKARARLASPPESLIISVTYFADPTAAAAAQADQVGQIDLGRAQVELAVPGRARFDGAALQQDRLGLIQGEPQVNINVYSGRKSSPDNLLDCGLFQDSVAIAASAPIQINCKLIGESE